MTAETALTNKEAIRLMARADRASSANPERGQTATKRAIHFLRDNWAAISLETRMAADHSCFSGTMRSALNCGFIDDTGALYRERERQIARRMTPGKNAN